MAGIVCAGAAQSSTSTAAVAKKKPGAAHTTSSPAKTAATAAKPTGTAKPSAKKPAASHTAAKTGVNPVAASSAKTRNKAGKAVVAHPSAKALAAQRRAVVPKVPATAQSIKLHSAFMASSQLRPMAQQLAATRSAAAYAGVTRYAYARTGEAAAAAYLALGHANMLDHRFADAAANFQMASRQGSALADYADYLGAQAQLQAGHGATAFALLNNFAARHPGSIFIANAPILLANAYMQQGDPQSALRVLEPLANTPQGSHADFLYTRGRANQLAGNTAAAARIYRGIYSSLPLSPESATARTQLDQIAPLTAAERKAHADQLFLAHRYAEAEAEYAAISRNDASLSVADRSALAIYEAVCQLKTKRLSKRDANTLPQTSDDSGAARLYILAETSRADNDTVLHRQMLEQMMQQFPHSHWLEEALYSGGNMYLLRRDYTQAIYHYATLVKLFPASTYAPSAHWRAAWMNYRLRNYAEAARLMDEQLQSYPGGQEIPGALYWRGRIYQDVEHNSGQALNYYRELSIDYPNYYYAILARQQLAHVGQTAAATPSPFLAFVNAPEIAPLTDALPENDIHLIRARLLANAALNEYIGPEMQAGAGGSTWGLLAQAEIYVSYGEYFRALQTMKHSGLPFFAYERAAVPVAYWHLLFPQPYWTDIVTNAEKNGLDPYLVASLIRQESEFNPSAMSKANAYGLMQLLPAVAKSVAKHEGDKHFNTPDLLQPATNIALGTANLRQVLARYNGQPEYALAAYNAGDTPVREWMSANDYKDIAEFVESIPYTETREYVEAILRNREMYRALYPTH
ncbi:MAG TPA: transglycosylase SLT domain-containing protein [Acidobacteriaceae bacterium]